ncbi:MAG TPA: succinylglutamate desuccinylase/aspartoacylase family protein [Candidatus Baltobacteraceae bacterium]|nr:succinylglutamate desuccinylase/aspartoacylase family protein [Candidatus Baltobacteraceae bacterium]
MDRPTYRELADRWRALRATHDVRVREVACVGAPRTLLCVEYGDPNLPTVLLSAGVHGDEPAGPLALLRLAQRRELDASFAYRIWPCTNPTGFDAGTRENVDGIDINRTFARGGSSPEAKAIVMANRDYKFALSIDLHEDDEAGAFYAFEYGIPGAVFADARKPDPALETREIGGLSLTLLLIRHASPRAMTLETPSAQPLEVRVDAHVGAVREALRWLSREQDAHGTARST